MNAEAGAVAGRCLPLSLQLPLPLKRHVNAHNQLCESTGKDAGGRAVKTRCPVYLVRDILAVDKDVQFRLTTDQEVIIGKAVQRIERLQLANCAVAGF